MSQFCTECGTENEDQAKFCNNCGTKLFGNNVNVAANTTTKAPFRPWNYIRSLFVFPALWMIIHLSMSGQITLESVTDASAGFLIIFFVPMTIFYIKYKLGTQDSAAKRALIKNTFIGTLVVFALAIAGVVNTKMDSAECRILNENIDDTLNEIDNGLVSVNATTNCSNATVRIDLYTEEEFLASESTTVENGSIHAVLRVNKHEIHLMDTNPRDGRNDTVDDALKDIVNNRYVPLISAKYTFK